MQNLILLLTKYSSIFLFLLLEGLCIYLVVQFNTRQKSIFINSSSAVSASIFSKYDNLTSYLNLQEINDSLQQENADLLTNIINQDLRIDRRIDTIGIDTIHSYAVTPAEIINKSLFQRNNNLTINKGRNDGISNGMGVISKHGIVGIVRNTTARFAHVMSLLNTQMQTSVKLKRSEILGELNWSGKDPTMMQMRAVPKHAFIDIGDTIVTSGYSTIFPKNYTVGTVESYELERNGFYTLDVKLSNDFFSLDRVYVVKHLFENEIDSLNVN